MDGDGSQLVLHQSLVDKFRVSDKQFVRLRITREVGVSVTCSPGRNLVIKDLYRLLDLVDPLKNPIFGLCYTFVFVQLF